MSESQKRYSTVAMLLHWSIALLIVFQIILGWRMESTKGAAAYAIFQMHKSVGITVLLLTLVRLVWRVTHKPPPLPDHLAPWEKRLSTAVHHLFYLILIGLPLTGWVLVSASKTNIPTLLYGTVPWPHLPFLPHLAPAAQAVWRKIGEIGHGALVKLTYVLLAAHIGGALKHQLIDRDDTLSRMLAGVKKGAWFDPRAIAAALVFVGVIVFGYRIFPSPPKTPAPTPAPITAPTPNPANVVEPAIAAPSQTASAPAPATPVKPDASKPLPAPDDWKVGSGSTLAFTTQWSGEAVVGHFTRWTAKIHFSPDNLAASSVRVEIDPASASTGDAQRDATLPTADWFAADKFPKGVFEAKSFQKLGAAYVAKGDLTLKGVKQPVILKFSLAIKGDAATAEATTQLDRTRFGVGQGDYGGTDQIPAAVGISAHIVATK